MHDWTLRSIIFDWKSAQVKFDFLNQHSMLVSILANGVSNLSVPRLNEWGPSVSVNNVEELIPLENGKYKMKIEMQSGDVIEIDAMTFIFPEKD